MAIAMVFCGLLPFGCAKVATVPSEADLAPPAYAELAEPHNARVHALRRIQSRGVVEMRWRDERGEHREPQADVDMYLDLPRRTALRISKLGNVYLWVGSDEDRFWMFDFLGGERLLHVGHHSDIYHEAGSIAVGPLVLLDLFAMSPLPLTHPDEAQQVTYSQQFDSWRVETQGEGGPIVIYFDRATHQPRRVESVSVDGRVLYYSSIPVDRYLSVPVPGVSAATPPRMPGLVDIFALGSEGETVGWLKLSLDSPTGYVDEGPMQRVFDLDRLIPALRPTRRIDLRESDLAVR